MRALVAASFLLFMGACRSAGQGPYAPASESDRNTALAQELSRKAADHISRDPASAEALLREALGEDLFFGPAHNNLGVLYLGQGKLYEAAGEFEWARKLMPGHPDPRMNLALTLEQAGQVDEAIQAYRTALEVWPGHLPTVQALARACVVHGREAPELAGWLDEIALQGDTPAWRQWAAAQRLKREERAILSTSSRSP